MEFPLKLRLRHLDGQIWRDEESKKVGTIRHEVNGDVTFEFCCDSGETRCVRRPRRDVTLLQPDLMRSVVERQRLERGELMAVRDPLLLGLPTDEALLIERWAIRVATITPVTVEIALPTVKRFRLAGGDEDMFTKLEQHVCRSGNSFIQLLSIVADLIRLGVVK